MRCRELCGVPRRALRAHDRPAGTPTGEVLAGSEPIGSGGRKVEEAVEERSGVGLPPARAVGYAIGTTVVVLWVERQEIADSSPVQVLATLAVAFPAALLFWAAVLHWCGKLFDRDRDRG